MMGTKERNFQALPEDISLEDLVPEDNFYRRLQQKLDLSFVRDLVEDLYAASECTESKNGREVLRYYDEDYVDRVKGYRDTFPYEKALRKRRVWVEPLFAEAKDWHGLRRFRLRRLEKVNIEALLIAAGQNIKRLVAARGRSPRKPAQVAALRPPEPASCCRPHLSGR